jgi:hypothetical protein
MEKRYIVRFQLDFSAEPVEDPVDPREEKEKNKNKKPLGETKTIVGTKKEIKERLNYEIDHLYYTYTSQGLNHFGG